MINVVQAAQEVQQRQAVDLTDLAQRARHLHALDARLSRGAGHQPLVRQQGLGDGLSYQSPGSRRVSAHKSTYTTSTPACSSAVACSPCRKVLLPVRRGASKKRDS